MPVITLDYKDLEKLTGTDRKTIISHIPMIGADVERVENDHVDIEFFPSRPDLYSVEGTARAMRGFLGIEKGLCEYEVRPYSVEIYKDVEIDKIRPVLGCAVVRNVKFTSSSIKSLMDLQEDLHWAIGRNRKKVSIGVHDMAHIRPPFKYQAVDPDYRFVPLDFSEPMSMREILKKHPKGVKFAHLVEGLPKYPLITDVDGNVLSFPPIINGTLTRVHEGTTDLFIDVTGLSDAVYTALIIVATALAERGGCIEFVRIINADGTEQLTPDMSPEIRKVTSEEVLDLLGIDISPEYIAQMLERMRFGAKVQENGIIEVQVPRYRADILDNSDLIEDIAIAYGYKNITPVLPMNATIGTQHYISLERGYIRTIMVGLGYTEVMPFTLTSEKVHFEWMCRPVTDDVTYVMHPISEDQTMVRTTLLPNLMEILSLNQHRELPQRIFEVGEVVVNDKNSLHLAAVSIHANANFTEIRELFDAIMREKQMVYEIVKSEDSAFLEGRRADVLVNGNKVGVLGELNPQVLVNFGLAQPVVGFEIKLF
ncbi:MAG: phenylalanine--tRNA ligase subunit beta [Methanomethylovorans sp.]|jgi:phenylalanyl-tRNA synthetase beta chain|nr:phenylalanine--tRNA ligase subunit beta [Methanomethylovorans sp.]